MSMSAFGSFGGQDTFSELLNRFFGMSPASSPPVVQRVRIGRLLTEPARELIGLARRKAVDDGSEDLDIQHLLWAACLVGPSRSLLAQACACPDDLVRVIEKVLSGVAGAPSAEPRLTPAAKRVLFTAHARSQAGGGSYVGPEHILAALLDAPDPGTGRVLGAGDVDVGRLREASDREVGGHPASKPASSTPTLDVYGRDLTDEAKAGKLDPVIGRGDEVEQTIEILSRRSKNIPVLVGEPGVGKTAIVEGLAQRIAADEVPATLRGKRVVALDLAGIAAGTSCRDEREERLRRVVNEVQQSRDSLILFVEELHVVAGTGAGAGGEGASDAAGNPLRAALSRGGLRVVGATTIEKYRRHIEKDAALGRRFQPVLVPEPGVEETARILEGLRDVYEAHHLVRFTDEALRAAAELSDRYLSDRFLPDKAVDLMDQAGARVRLTSLSRSTEAGEREDRIAGLEREKDQAIAAEDFERAKQLKELLVEAEAEAERGWAGFAERRAAVPAVTVDDIADVVSRRTGIPIARLTRDEKLQLLQLEQDLHVRVVGQDEAVVAVSEVVRRNRAGMAEPNRPVGCFLFLGPTGVGRTELAKALAELLFGDENRLIRFDMSEFQEEQSVSRLVGAPPGCVGHGEPGRLVELVRRRPHSVLLLDEVEKAHPDFLRTLLQALGDGRLTDAQGRAVDFRHTVVIATSHVGAQRIQAHYGDTDSIREQLTADLRDHLPPEFLDRIDATVIFHALSGADLGHIVDLLLRGSERRVESLGMELEVTSAARDLLVAHGHQPEFGARLLRRTIQSELDNRVATLLLGGEATPGDTIVADAQGDALVCAVRKPGTAATQALPEVPETTTEPEESVRG